MAKKAVMHFAEGRFVPHIAAADIAVGDVVVLNALAADAMDKQIGIATEDIAKDASGMLDLRGVYAMAAIATAAFVAGQKLYWDSAAETPCLTNIPGAAAGAAVAGAENTGNGKLGAVTVETDAPAETWTLTCTAASTGAGTFSVIGSKSGKRADMTVAVAYDNDIVAFTLAAGTTDFAVGDVITFPVAHANAYAGRCHAAKTSTGTSAEVRINDR